MSDIERIANEESGRNVSECRDAQEIAMEAQHRNIALLRALDVLADHLDRIAAALEDRNFHDGISADHHSTR